MIDTPGFPKPDGTFEHLRELTMFNYNKDSLDYRLLTLIQDLGMVVYWSEIFYTPPNTWVPIHADTNQLSNMAKINIHAGHSDCTISWYNPLPEHAHKKPLQTPLDTEYLMYSHDEVKKIHTTCIDNVSIMNAGVPHGFHNNTNEPSWILSLVLFKNGFNAQFEEVSTLFKNYIKQQ
jgi:hypothetical protein